MFFSYGVQAGYVEDAHGFSNFKLAFCNLLLPELIVERCFQSNLGVDLYKVHWDTFRDTFRPHQKDIVTDVVSDLMKSTEVI